MLEGHCCCIAKLRRVVQIQERGRFGCERVHLQERDLPFRLLWYRIRVHCRSVPSSLSVRLVSSWLNGDQQAAIEYLMARRVFDE